MAGRRAKRLRNVFLVMVALLLALLGVRWLMFRGPARPPQALPEAGILDLHCHVAGVGAGESGCFVSQDMQDSWKFNTYLESFGLEVEELQSCGDAVIFDRLRVRLQQSEHVAAAVVLAIDAIVGDDGTVDQGNTEFYVPNEFVAKHATVFPEVFYGASVHPNRKDALERLEAAKEQGAVLVKWLPAIQWIDPADARYVPFYEKLKELNLPLLSHAGQERSFTKARDEFSDPVRLRLPLEIGVTVIAAHAASTGENEGVDNVTRLVGLLEEFPNLYVDVSSLTQVNKLGYLRRVLLEERFEGRLLYGSDYPLICTLLVSPWYFPLDLTFGTMRELSNVENPFDRDVRMKQALGVPAVAFNRSAELLEVDLP